MDKICSAISFPFFWECNKDSICFDAFPPQFRSTEGVSGLCCLTPDATDRETDFQFELQVTKSVCENVDTETVTGFSRLYPSFIPAALIHSFMVLYFSASLFLTLL